MQNPRITLIVEGTEDDHGDVRLDVFLSQLANLQDALRKLDASIGGGVRSSYFAVVGLSHSSPATVELELRQRRGRAGPDVRRQVLGHFQSAVESVAAGNIPDDIDYGLVEDLRNIAAPVGTALRAVRIRVEDVALDFDSTFAARADKELADSETCITTIEGMLEKINVHGAANVFHIYPDVGPKFVKCKFGPELEDKAVAAIKRRVAVTGTAHYRRKSAFPHLLDVTAIEIYSPAAELADFDVLKGRAPNATGDMIAADFIRERRDAWQ